MAVASQLIDIYASERCIDVMDCNHRLRSCSLSRPRLFIIASLVFVFLLFQFVTIDELQIIHFKHRQGGKRLEPDQFDSTCSRAADQRGPHQKIISYSIYGNFCRAEIAKKYLKPFIQTLTRIPSAYPGWVVRIYHNVTKDDGETWNMINNTLNLGSHIDFCNATEIIRNRKLADIFAMTWRWLPLLDNMVDTLMSRDSDSYIITREADAVQAWLAGDRAFHIMRDHPSHCRFIVGCCWGVKVSQNRSSIVRAATSMFTQNHLHEYDYDQKLLDKLIWPIAYNNMIAHDSYCCERLPLTHPYPTKRKDGLFIGWRAVPKEELQFPCPPKCRPANTSDWSFC